MSGSTSTPLPRSHSSASSSESKSSEDFRPISQFWKPNEVPKPKSTDFSPYLRSKSEDNERRHIPVPQKDSCISCPHPYNPKTYSSFGDQGLTATVNANGDIINFSRYLGVGVSGMFVVDHTETPEPVYVYNRAKHILETSPEDSSDSVISYGLRFPDLNFDHGPELTYVDYRWPRFEYRSDKIEMSIQWIIRKGLLLQQHVVTNLGNDQVTVPFLFHDRMLICDLEDQNWTNSFNGNYDYSFSEGPNGFGWTLVHKLPPNYGSNRQDTGRQTGRLSTSSTQATQVRSSNHPDTLAGGPLNQVDVVESSTNSQNPDEDQVGVKKDGIAVVVSVFVNGEPQLWNDGEWSQILDSNDPESTTERTTSMEVIIAYDLLFLPGGSAHWSNFVFPVSDIDMSGVNTASASEFSLSRIDTSPDIAGATNTEETANTVDPKNDGVKSPDLKLSDGIPLCSSLPKSPTGRNIEYALRRHLEHILSVCAIPIRRPILRGEVTPDSTPESDEDPIPVVLTCGDVSGHRVCSSASFFAFLFLLDVAKRLNQIAAGDGQATSLRDRIYTACKGHLRWVFNVAQRSQERSTKSCFAANYWPSGDIIQTELPWYPDDSITDTPFQLIKAVEFATAFNENKDHKLARKMIAKVYIPWTQMLLRKDPRNIIVWPHSKDEGFNVYRLDDNVWVWKALEGVESLYTRGHDPDIDSQASFSSKLSSRDVQREVLRRFTVVNELCRERMLAVTRSPRDTRFLFHARDTALFYAPNWNFFTEQASSFELWQNTIQAQVYHEENQETEWANNLRYALAVAVGSRGYSLNRKTAKELVESGMKVLCESTSPNGFFPGTLDEDTKLPKLFDSKHDRDFYFHAGFEIPFVLLQHASLINKILDKSEDSVQNAIGNEESPSPQSTAGKESVKYGFDSISSRMQISLALHDLLFAASETAPHEVATKQDDLVVERLGRLAINPSKTIRKNLSLKKYIPFNSKIDSSSIVDIDEEWLYNYPPFFQDQTETEDIKWEDVISGNEEALGRLGRRNATGKVMQRGLRKFEDAKKVPYHERWMELFVIDTPKRKYNNRSDKTLSSHWARNFSAERLREYLGQPRTAERAKKRFIWLPKVDESIAFICYAFTPMEEEREALSSFFDRHENYEKYIYDDTTSVLNTWETELHLGFYQLMDSQSKLNGGIPEPSEDDLPGMGKKKIVRASTGFRFTGDIFDRYWTCYLVEYLPAKRGSRYDSPFLSNWDFDFTGALEDRDWRQRKILELLLFDRILGTMTQSTRDIFNEIKDELGVRRGALSFSVINSDDYFSSSLYWQQFQQILQAIGEELAAVLEIIDKWETREQDRGQEQPRWTRNDERKYRNKINKLRGSTRGKIKDLRTLATGIRLLKETLISSQDQVRQDLGLRGAENVRFFTYVTVVFLPLGFASSLFSMSEVPGGVVLNSMIICAIVALLVTVILLMNAKRIGGVVERISLVADQYSRNTMRNSAVLQRMQSQRDEKRRENDETQEDPITRKRMPRWKKHQETASSWRIWFWPVYILVELPAQLVLMAYQVVKDFGPPWAWLVYVPTGVLALPFFAIFWLLQLVLCNAIDLVRLSGGCLKWAISASQLDGNSSGIARLGRWIYPPDEFRPLKLLDQELKKTLLDDWAQQSTVKRKDEGGEQNDTDESV